MHIYYLWEVFQRLLGNYAIFTVIIHWSNFIIETCTCALHSNLGGMHIIFNDSNNFIIKEWNSTAYSILNQMYEVNFE